MRFARFFGTPAPVRSSLGALAAGALLLSAQGASAALLASDPFAYPAGPLAGQNGGAGFTSAWANAGTIGTVSVTMPGLTFGSDVVTGNAVTSVLNAGGGGNNVTRTLSGPVPTGSATLYGSYLISQSSRFNALTVNSILLGSAAADDSGAAVDFAAEDYGNAGNVGGIRFNNQQTPFSNGSSALALGSTFLYLFEVTGLGTTSQSASGWVLSQAQYETFKAAGITEANLNNATLGIGATNVWARGSASTTTGVTAVPTDLHVFAYSGTGPMTSTFDEVRLSNVSLAEAATAPEPASVGLLAASAAGLLMRRRRGVQHV